MSSICGIVDFESGLVDFDTLRDMSRAMILRGREQSGAYINRGVGLAHGRMILSGSERDRQPYTVTRGGHTYTVVFDGELYNIGSVADIFELCGFSCAAEAVLESYIAFGYECAEYLDGAFAFAIYDEYRNEVFLARDKMGGKPLYYMRDGLRLLFSSEIKGLLRSMPEGAQIDMGAVRTLVSGAVGEVSGVDVYREISELPVGSFAIHSRLGTQLWGYTHRIDGDEFDRWQRCGKVLMTDYDTECREVEPMLREILTAFDYPCFDEYMLGFLTTLKNNRKLGTVTVEDHSLDFGSEYALQRADRLGMMNGVMVRITPAAEDKRIRKAIFVKMEKQLSQIAERVFAECGESFAKLLGADIFYLVGQEKDIRKRIRIYGAALQTEYWLRNYPISLK